jgi:23S rRNA-/tRNA-specific pseudouridylate synthase
MQGAVTVAVHKDKSNTASFSQAVATQSVNFVRVRPDTRGRFHQIRISYTSLVPDDMLLNAVELKYRGGKEH